jgi:hypothetical protein
MIIVFDGVDEIISASERRDVIEYTRFFTNRFPLNRFMYTCRKTDFKTTPVTGVQIFILQPFSEKEVQAYFRSASRHVFQRNDEKIRNCEEDFLNQAKKHASEFIHNPLLLALIVWIYNTGQRIPDNRIQLYQECSELLFKRWDALKAIDPDLPDAHWLDQLVTEIAHKLYLFDRSQEGEPDRDWLRARTLEFFRGVYVDDVENRARAAADRFVKHLIGRSWILQEQSAGIFEFTHRTFMEYYFARWLHDAYDGINILFDHVACHICAGEWTDPIHLVFQMKAAGKLRSAESFTKLLIELVERTRDTDELPNVTRFLANSIGYLQPSEILMVRITKALAGAVNSGAEWFSVVGDIVASPTEFQNAIIEGVYEGLADDIANRQGRTIGFVVDWLYACYLHKRPRHSITFSSHVLRLSDVRQRFGVKFLNQVRASPAGLGSLPKMTFDLTGVTLPSVSEVGLKMWDASIMSVNRLDWRLIDFGLGLNESIDVILYGVQIADCPYVELFSKLSEIIPRQRNYPSSPGVMILSGFNFGVLRDIADEPRNCSTSVALSFAVSLMGLTELSSGFGVGGFDQVIDRCLLLVSERNDVNIDFRNYIQYWRVGQHRMFRPIGRTGYIDHNSAFTSF